MKLTQILTSVFLLLLLAGTSPAQINRSGGAGLPNVQSAWGLEPGSLIMNSNSRVFGKTANPTDRSAFTVWDITGRLNFSYGLSKHMEISVTPVVYQDINKPSNKISAPHDLYISMKIGSFTSPGRTLAYGVAAAARFPTGEAQNIPFERYSANRVGWGITGLLSYSKDPLFPDRSTNVHLNLGYWNHNDVGAKLNGAENSGISANKMSQELLYGIGVQIPKNKVSFTIELYGNTFLQQPPTVAYSRENYLYLTPGVSYQPFRWMSLNLGIDLRVIDTADKTTYSSDNTGIDRTLPNSQPNYPGWRINIGTSFDLLPTSSYRMSERDILMKKANSRRELFEQIVREQRETESAEAELERIRYERIRAEKELERLRRILEGETKKVSEKEQEKEK